MKSSMKISVSFSFSKYHTDVFLYLVQNDANLVITHETSPEWRNAILSNKPSLLALR
jgi:hypothetical protein